MKKFCLGGLVQASACHCHGVEAHLASIVVAVVVASGALSLLLLLTPKPLSFLAHPLCGAICSELQAGTMAAPNAKKLYTRYVL